jgi:hypothetical protein
LPLFSKYSINVQCINHLVDGKRIVFYVPQVGMH